MRVRSALIPPCVALLASGLAFGQGTGAVTFEVASVKPSAPGWEKGGVYFGPARGGPGTPDPAQITWTYARFRDLLMTAYDVKTYQLIGPAWLDAERYDIVAKVPAGASKEQVSVMWQNLLAERFGVKVHHESKEFQVEELVVAKGGSKLKETAEDVTAPPSPGPPNFKNGVLAGPGMVTSIMMGGNNRGSAHAVARAQPLSKLTVMLTAQRNHPVLDKTGLTGLYDFDLDFTMDITGVPLPPGAQPAPSTGASDPGSDIAAAVQQQLGLRLVDGRANLDMVIIDKAEKIPTEN
jgi:uncharacterized protein (TIGR03435 family)